MIDIAKQELHLWFADQADFPLPVLEKQCLGWLSDRELARYKRYRLEKSRHEFLLGQMLVRATLTEYQPTPPGEWVFGVVANGKPVLLQPPGKQPLYFNLTHSKGRVALALGRHNLIGIDLESLKARRRSREIADRHFSPWEVEQLLALDEAAQQARFYELWTLKESYIKATGEGLKIPLDSFGFDFNDEAVQFWLQSERQMRAEDWRFWQLDSGKDYRLALACCPDRDSTVSKIQSFRRTAIAEFQESDTKVTRSC